MTVPIAATLTRLPATATCQPAAILIRPPADETRIPLHFLALIDTSDSMNDNDKLNHVKHCLSLLTQFLIPDDFLSVVTFGEGADVVLRRVKGEGASLHTAQAAIRALITNGCTNLSAGLIAVRGLLDEEGAGAAGGAAGAPAPTPLKPHLLLLTDGHANRGVTLPYKLQELTAAIQARFPTLSYSFLAYGTDHNAELLRSLAAQHLTSYSVVQDLESAALTMGESLGGAMSCCAQGVTIQCPPGTVAHGAYQADATGRIRVGDLYAGSEVYLCIDLPLEGPTTCTMEGTSLPSMERFHAPIEENAVEIPSASILLTRLQIRVSAIYRQMREYEHGSPPSLAEEVEAIRAALGAPEFDGHPVAEMLRQELPSLDAAVRRHRHGLDQTLRTELATHEQFVLLGRGTAQPIAQASWQNRPMVWSMRGGYSSDDDDALGDDPEAPTELPRTLRAARASYLSPTSSTRTRRVAEAMQTLSQAPGPAAPDSD